MPTWQKGQSGNPGGRPKGLARIRELAAEHNETAIKALVDIATDGKSEAARVSAATALLDRAYGKPAQPVDGDGDGGPIQVEDMPRAKVVHALLNVLRSEGEG